MNNKKICPKCGNVLNSDDTFCNMCGTKLSEENRTYQTVNTNQQFGANQPYNNQNNGSDPNNQKNKKTLRIALIAVAVVLVLLIGYVIGNSGNKNDDYVPEETTSDYDYDDYDDEPITEEPTTEETTKERLEGIYSNRNYLYGVGDGYDGGAVYLMMYFDCYDTDFDGYEVRMTNPYDDYQTIPNFIVDKDWDCVYYGSQDPCYTVEIRTYRGDSYNGYEYSDWYTLCTQAGAESLYSSQVNMSDNKWESTYAKDGYELKY